MDVCGVFFSYDKKRKEKGGPTGRLCGREGGPFLFFPFFIYFTNIDLFVPDRELSLSISKVTAYTLKSRRSSVVFLGMCLNKRASKCSRNLLMHKQIKRISQNEWLSLSVFSPVK